MDWNSSHVGHCILLAKAAFDLAVRAVTFELTP